MQALNSLATPEEKLAALCKKYADLVSLGLSLTLCLFSRRAGILGPETDTRADDLHRCDTKN